MTMLANVSRELAGLFVDDGALALAILAVVALAGVMAMLGLPLAAGAILLFGCLGVLLANTVSVGRR
jgi:2-keto-4-pentenoate hydratase